MDDINFDDLKANVKNPRKMSKHDAASLKTSMTEFGDLSGIVLNTATNQLVGGHQRVETFKQLDGLKKVVITQRFAQPTTVGTTAYGYVTYGGEFFGFREVTWPVDGKDADGREVSSKEMAANIAANRIQGEFDIDLLSEMDWWLKENNPDMLEWTGQTPEELSHYLDAAGPDGEEDEAPELDEVNPPVSKLGEVYQLGRHRLMCGSATEITDVGELMNGQLADMIFTDPPYNVAYEGKTAEALTIENDSMSDADFCKFLLDAHTSMAEVTKAGGAIYVCHADSEGMNFRKALIDAGFLLKQCIIWVKQSMVMGRQDYQWQHEPILYGWKDGAAHFFVDDRTQTTVWNINRPSKNIEHPTMKPIELCARAIKNSSIRGAIIIDFFGGSGSTLMAADQNDRICYTMELDPRYVDVIRKRYSIAEDQADWISNTPVVNG